MKYYNKTRLIALIATVLSFVMLISVIAAATPRITFTNARDVNITFTVKKAVQSSTADALPDSISEDEFSFKLLFGSSPASGVKYYLYDADGTEWVQYYDTSTSEYTTCERSKVPSDFEDAVVPFTTDESGIFKLKDGRYAVFYGKNLRVNTAYTVTEVTDTDGKCVFTKDDKTYYYKPTLASQSGTITDGVNSEEFTNTYYPPEEKKTTCNLQITKNIITKSGYTSAGGGTFQYKIVLDGENYSNQAYKVYTIGGTTVVSQGTTDDKGVMELEGGQYAVFENVPTNMEYFVYEYQNGSWWSVDGTSGKTTVNGETVNYADFRNSSTTAPSTNVEFTNRRASFIVSKRIADNKTDELGTNFTFELRDENGNPWVNRPYYLYSTNGALIGRNNDEDLSAKLYYTDSVGRFTLKANQAAMFIGMKEGTKYTVKEVENPLYRQVTPESADTYTNKSVLSSIEELPFTNEVLEQVGLFVRKTVNNSTSDSKTDKEYTFTLLDSDGNAVVNASYIDQDNNSKTTDSSGQFTLKDGGYAHFTKLTKGKYQVKESSTGEKNITVTAKLGSDSLKVTDDNGYLTDNFTVKTDDVTSVEFVNTYGDYRFMIVKNIVKGNTLIDRLTDYDTSQRYLFKIERYESKADTTPQETFYKELNCNSSGEASVAVDCPSGGWYKVTEVSEYNTKTFDDYAQYEQGSTTVEYGNTSNDNVSVGQNRPYVWFNLTELYDVNSLPEAHFYNQQRPYNYNSTQGFVENVVKKLNAAIQS